MIWTILNIVLSAVVGLILAYKLAVLSDHFSLPERVGMGLLGAGCVLTIGPLLSPQGSPYESWAGSMFRLGCAIYFVGRMLRYDIIWRKAP